MALRYKREDGVVKLMEKRQRLRPGQKMIPCTQCPEFVEESLAHTFEVAFGKVLKFCSAGCKSHYLHDVH